MKYEISVTGIICVDDKYLIVQRSHKSKKFKGKWTVPGGKLELKDYIDKVPNKDKQWYNALERALKREVREEVGLEIKDIKYLTNIIFGKTEPTLVISFYCNCVSNIIEVKLSDELIDYKWVTIKDAVTYDFIDGIYKELVEVDIYKKSMNNFSEVIKIIEAGLEKNRIKVIAYANLLTKKVNVKQAEMIIDRITGEYKKKQHLKWQSLKRFLENEKKMRKKKKIDDKFVPPCDVFWKIRLIWIIGLHRLRYKQIFDDKTHKVYLKDRLLFWKKPEWKGLVYV